MSLHRILALALCLILPTFASVGWWAPGLLIALRVVQGFSTGGEYGGAATFLAEHAPDDKRGRYGSFLEFGALAGFMFGSAVVLGLESVLTSEGTPEMHTLMIGQALTGEPAYR